MISPSGNEAVLTLAIARGLLTPCFSTEIVSEYEDVLHRRKFGFDADPMMASSSHAPLSAGRIPRHREQATFSRVLTAGHEAGQRARVDRGDHAYASMRDCLWNFNFHLRVLSINGEQEEGQAMYCNYCGRVIQDDAMVCAYCGTRVGASLARRKLIRPRLGRKWR